MSSDKLYTLVPLHCQQAAYYQNPYVTPISINGETVSTNDSFSSYTTEATSDVATLTPNISFETPMPPSSAVQYTVDTSPLQARNHATPLSTSSQHSNQTKLWIMIQALHQLGWGITKFLHKWVSCDVEMDHHQYHTIHD